MNLEADDPSQGSGFEEFSKQMILNHNKLLSLFYLTTHCTIHNRAFDESTTCMLDNFNRNFNNIHQ